MRHQFFIQQFDFSFLKVSKSEYLHYLKRVRNFTTFRHEILYDYVPGIPRLFINPIVQHYLVIKHSWL